MAKKGKKKKKSKKMSPELKAFLKREGRFPRKGELRGAKKAARASKKQAQRSRSMAKTGGGGSRKQGIVSWITSLIALLIGFGPVWRTLANWFATGNTEGAIQGLNAHYNPLSGNKETLAIGYGSLVGGIVFKIASSELVRRAKMRSLIPNMTA